MLADRRLGKDENALWGRTARPHRSERACEAEGHAAGMPFSRFRTERPGSFLDKAGLARNVPPLCRRSGTAPA